jgi:hypothetical protein
MPLDRRGLNVELDTVQMPKTIGDVQDQDWWIWRTLGPSGYVSASRKYVASLEEE